MRISYDSWFSRDLKNSISKNSSCNDVSSDMNNSSYDNIYNKYHKNYTGKKSYGRKHNFISPQKKNKKNKKQSNFRKPTNKGYSVDLNMIGAPCKNTPSTNINGAQDIVVTQEFNNLFDTLENTHKSVILFGSAGTGKSSFLRWFRSKSKKNITVVAPTGISALNVSGSTIHSLFLFPPKLITNDDIKYLGEKRKNVLKHTDILVIDEISMVRADLLDAISNSLQINLNSTRPFAGKQLLFIGDMFQLSPIITGDTELFNKAYEGPYFFNSDSYKQVSFEYFRFTKIFRQKDETFINHLNNLRFGDNTLEDINYFNRRFVPCLDKDIITLTSYVKTAQEINNDRYEELTTKEHIYEGQVEGKFKVENLLTPITLRLKVGCQVIFTKNTDSYKNGTIGTVVSLDKDSVIVKVGTTNITVHKEKWENTEKYWDDKDQTFKELVIGTFVQFPLTLGWAITIHKSQGQTYKAVKIDVGRGLFAEGQLYTALSRCVDYNNLYLLRPIRQSDVLCSQPLLQWYKHKFGVLK